MTRTVVELDLVGYSAIGDNIEQALDVTSVSQLNQQIQGFVDAGLEAIKATRDRTVMVTTGDGAILVLGSPALAHRFAQAVHTATHKHNRARSAALAKRVFRIGAATGEIVMEPKPGGGFEIAGTTIARAVRLEAKAKPGGLLVDKATFAALPAALVHQYGPKQTVTGKRDEQFDAYHCSLNKDGPKDAAFFSEQARKEPKPETEAKQFGLDRRKDVLARFKRLKSHQYAELLFLLEIPIGQRPPDTLTPDEKMAKVLPWAEGSGSLDLLHDVLRELTEPEVISRPKIVVASPRRHARNSRGHEPQSQEPHGGPQQHLRHLVSAKQPGLVLASMLRSQTRIPGEEFAIELLYNPVELTRDAHGRVTARIDRRGVEHAIISNAGKRAVWKQLVTGKNRARLFDKDRQVQRFLSGTGAATLIVDPGELGVAFRWASGGVLSIVRYKGRQWVPLFFRDIPPYGWNIALGSSERWFLNDVVRRDNQIENEWNAPRQFIFREFLEELLVLDGAPSRTDDRRLRPMVLKSFDDVTPGILQGREFNAKSVELRCTQESLLLNRTGENPITVRPKPGFCNIEILSDGHVEVTETHNVLVCFSLMDLGIEVVQAVEYTLRKTDYLLDGERKDDGNGAPQLVRMPMALVSCDYLASVFGHPDAALEYDETDPPSIRMPSFSPSEEQGQIHPFNWDVEQRLNAIRDENGDPWQKKRAMLWHDRFRQNFVDDRGRPSWRNPSNLFVPGTAKILNLYFTKMYGWPSTANGRFRTHFPASRQGAARSATSHAAAKHVFLSYCHDNAAEVAQLRGDLIASGEAVWWDKDILPGQDWKQEIRRAMKGSYAVVVCLSEELAARSQSGVYPEVSEAIGIYRKQKPGSIFLIPVRLSDCEIPDIEIDDTRTLDRLQHVDLFPASKRAAGLQHLLKALRASPGRP